MGLAYMMRKAKKKEVTKVNMNSQPTCPFPFESSEFMACNASLFSESKSPEATAHPIFVN
jgi:hypothetical protein